MRTVEMRNETSNCLLPIFLIRHIVGFLVSWGKGGSQLCLIIILMSRESFTVGQYEVGSSNSWRMDHSTLLH